MDLKQHFGYHDRFLSFFHVNTIVLGLAQPIPKRSNKTPWVRTRELIRASTHRTANCNVKMRVSYIEHDESE
jgi:hypothetical protein